MRIPAVLSWSSGKDAAYALHVVRRRGVYEIIGLLTAVEALSGRVVTHGVRRALLEQQLLAVGLPVTRVLLPHAPSNAVYERAMARALRRFRSRGVRHVIFGDLFLEDIRQYREHQLSALGMQCLFPLWHRNTRALARHMVRSGLRARVVSVDTRRLPAELAGRAFDDAFLDSLPASVDPCGENGEFHTFVTSGPMLKHPIPVEVGPVRVQEGFALADLRPRRGHRFAEPPSRRKA